MGVISCEVLAVFLVGTAQSLAIAGSQGSNAENCLATMLFGEYPRYGRPVLQVGTAPSFVHFKNF